LRLKTARILTHTRGLIYRNSRTIDASEASRSMNIELVPPSSEANNQSIPRNPSERAVMSYLTQQNRVDIRAALEAQRGKLIKAMQAALEESGQTQFSEVLGRASGDSADEALAVTLGDLSAARLDHEVRALQALENARLRLDDEDFGLCVDCEAEIPIARLIANPVSTRCIACQSHFEHTHAGLQHGSI
jgi:RNA polymerase-binding transcription factor DksA